MLHDHLPSFSIQSSGGSTLPNSDWTWGRIDTLSTADDSVGQSWRQEHKSTRGLYRHSNSEGGQNSESPRMCVWNEYVYI